MEAFKRINFFTGFFTQADDWNDAQKYFLEKKKLHQRSFITPGVIFDCLGDLKVTAEERLGVYVAPGYAIDDEGRDLFLPKPERLTIDPTEYKVPETVYIVIEYNEESIDIRPNIANPQHSGTAFIQELPKIFVTAEEPDNIKTLELARIELKHTRGIDDAKDPSNPGPNEIDLRYVKRAGLKGFASLSDLGKVIREGEISVAVSKEKVPSPDDTSVFLESVTAEDAHRYYLVSAFTRTTGCNISWRIESSFEDDKVRYNLFFKNFAKKTAKVHYRVFRFEEG